MKHPEIGAILVPPTDNSIKISWIRCHVAVRNGRNSISQAFMTPDYDIILKDRCFYISRNNELVTIVPIENIVEFTI